MDCAKAAAEAAEITQKQLMETQGLKRRLQSFGVIVETLDGSKPIDVMEHIGKHNEHRNVVWRAGCWANRGVSAVLTGAFQWASAHLAVDAKGGRFWQLMLAERAVQAACGPESKVKVFSSDDDLSLEYCDTVETDSDCALTVDGRSIRHVRLDCRVSLVGDSKPLILTSKRKQKR
uniref:Uncharacterized protein n=1 Tax=Craspedostauros australis TaxID=1486917 RepID=A0A7R9WXI1_9STRA|mmetsp:Transcript_24229/g.67523  ORF Transcript_24229/g.67523 Transcript_24229/m.67523 type:complete len:176 (+) Transcript_24229:248-775(+)